MERKIEDYNNALRDVLNLMSITRKYKVVGSANLRTSEFIQDYDIDGMLNTNGNKENFSLKFHHWETPIFTEYFQSDKELRRKKLLKLNKVK
jgi:hypothetical protein